MEYNNTDIAVIGLSGVFPKAGNIGVLWSNLVDQKSGISFYTEEELIQYGIPEDLVKRSDYVKARGDVADIDMFDSELFHISTYEADLMDPQHRILLECSYSALEDAGCNPEKYKGRIGIFAGCSMNSYLFYNIYPSLQKTFSSKTLLASIGNDKDSLTSTVAYRLNLKGPAVTVQSSSSTSLTAICFACQSLLNYQCDAVLAGGVSLGPPEKGGYLYEKDGILSPDGKCRSFDQDAAGFVPGSGCGIVVLKRLKDAIRENDHIYAVVKGYAVNNDGAGKVSYSSPSVLSQVEVIKDAQEFAGVCPEDIDYIEAHGTGTKLGDPIEFEALKTVFSGYHDEYKCAVGSIKSNIGHLDTAAGVAGFIKTSLMLYNKKIVGNMNFNNPNPYLDIDNSPFYIPKKTKDWISRPGKLRTAGVTSLGMGGTNAHIILQEYVENKSQEEDSNNPSLLMFSANTPEALDKVVENMATYLETNNVSLNNVAYTLYNGRQELKQRFSVVCNDLQEAILTLKMGGRKYTNSIKSNKKIAFVFPGQGVQRVRMFQSIYLKYDYFKKIVDFCFQYIKESWSIDLMPILFPADENYNEAEKLIFETRYAQCILFCVQYAMAKLYINLNINPDVLIGHSLGEYVAACVAGVMSLEDTIDLLVKRSRLMDDMEPGIMLAVHSGVDDIVDLLDESISIACINAKNSIVLSGPETNIQNLQKTLVEKNVSYKQLSNQRAFHSWMTNNILPAYKNEVDKVVLKTPNIPFVSNLTGKIIKNEEVTDPEYWIKHTANTVQFYEGIKLLEEDTVYYLEIGPGTSLSEIISGIIGSENKNRILTQTLSKEKNDQKDFYTVLGKLWECGFEIDLSQLYPEASRKISLPSYPFQKKSHWIGDKILDKYEIEKPKSQISKQDAPDSSINLTKKVAMIFHEILGDNSIKNDESFFDYGGHSLMAITMLTRLKEVFNIELSLSEFFEKPTINAVAGMIKNADKKESFFDSLLNEIMELPD